VPDSITQLSAAQVMGRDVLGRRGSGMAQGDLDIGLLLKIMTRLGQTRGQHNPLFLPHTGEFMDSVVSEERTGLPALNHLDRHIDFLREEGLLTTSPAGIHRALRLTAKGQKFVQPELAAFGSQPMLPQVVKSLEERIDVLTYPQKEKDRMLYSLREAISKQVPEIIAKVMVEIGAKILSGGGH
jgi:hypothetical protein